MRIESELFYCESILDHPESLSIIRSFHIEKETGFGLEYYLKNVAVSDEMTGLARTYLVRDNETGELVGYFSLKAGSTAANVRRKLFRIDMDSIPAIELANFAVNDAYRLAHKEYNGIGKVIFIYFILPICRKSSTYIGINTLYLFALPYEHLIQYYRSLNFDRLPKTIEVYTHRYHKPRYDRDCIFMSRSLEDIDGQVRYD